MKEDLRVTVTKQVIHKAMIHLPEKKRIDNIKRSELCTQAGVNRATFYRHYGTLQDVLREMETEIIRNMPLSDGPPKSQEEIRHKVESVCNYMYDNAHILRVLFTNSTDDDMTKSLMSLYEELVLRHRNEFKFSGLSEEAHQIMIALFGGGAYSLLKRWIMGEIEKTPTELAGVLYNIICFQGLFDMISISTNTKSFCHDKIYDKKY